MGKTKEKTDRRKLVDAKELAKDLQLHVKTIMRYASQGVIPCVRISPRCVRFDPGQVMAALEKRGAAK